VSGLIATPSGFAGSSARSFQLKIIDQTVIRFGWVPKSVSALMSTLRCARAPSMTTVSGLTLVG
jgi:hypothetical protein